MTYLIKLYGTNKFFINRYYYVQIICWHLELFIMIKLYMISKLVYK